MASTALKLVQSMKRDWMQTGRRPSGICGAALFVACHMNGVERSKKDIIAVVHIGWSTIEARVRELAATSVGSMTKEQFEAAVPADLENVAVRRPQSAFNAS